MLSDDLVGRCVPCEPECLRCTDLPSVCTECVDGFELFGDSCIVPCGELQFRADDGRLVTASLFALHVLLQ